MAPPVLASAARRPLGLTGRLGCVGGDPSSSPAGHWCVLWPWAERLQLSESLVYFSLSSCFLACLSAPPSSPLLPSIPSPSPVSECEPVLTSVRTLVTADPTGGLKGKNHPLPGDGFIPGQKRSPEKEMAPPPVTLPGELRGQDGHNRLQFRQLQNSQTRSAATQ